ncbi:MAG TPA: DUF1684 domain-containing protein [Candidatus Polarisedimenticolaceae bacterium]|nr:DUF1684 domain-containing protein [Candidatus Polarisedimenticolaceae bacterium]
MRMVTILTILMLGGSAGAAETAAWQKADAQWREARLARLRSPEGWLSLVGLHWIDAAPRRFGSAPDNEIVLPDGPAHAGSFHASVRGITVQPEPGAVLLAGKPLAGPRLLRGDDQAEPDVLQVGRLRLTAIKRGIKWGIRAKDPASAVLRDFKGIESWPIEASWRIEAAWDPYPEPRQRMIATAQGTHESVQVPGLARFTLGGVPVTLEPILEEPDATELLFVFKDATSGRQTYGGGRFLYADLPRDGKIVLDFNRAYNPPCAFTPYATCPLPPPGNRLQVAIEAGEKKYGGADPHAARELTPPPAAGR